MLLRYFLTKFFIRLLLLLVTLVPVFSSCDMIARLASVPFSFQILKFFWFMLPLICQFALPIASSLAVGITVGNLFARDELLLLHYFPDVRRKLELAVWIFSFFLILLFIPLLFKIAPASYWEGKRFLIRAAQVQIENLPPKQFHQVASRCTIFFKDKKKEEVGEKTKFKHILLMVRQKNNKEYLVSAEEGEVHDGTLTLSIGTIYNKDIKNECVAGFKKLEIAFEKLFFDAEKKAKKPTKFLTWQEMVQKEKASDNFNKFKELHKRVGLVLWQLLFPFLMLWIIMLFGQAKSNLLMSVLVGGGLFLGSYIHVNMAYFISGTLLSVVFYCVPLVTATVLYVMYKKQWP